MAKNFAEIFIKLGLKKEGFDKEIKKSESGFKDMAKNIAKTGAIIGGVVVGATLAGKAIWNMGKIQGFVNILGETGTKIFFIIFGLVVGGFGVWFLTW